MQVVNKKAPFVHNQIASDYWSYEYLVNFLLWNTTLNINQSTYRWLITYKLYHLPFWFVYHYCWWAMAIGSPIDAAYNIFHSEYAVKNLFYVFFQAFGVYFNLYYLIPKFLEKGRYFPYLLLLLLDVFCVASLIVTGYYFTAWLSDRTLFELFKVQPDNYLHFFMVNSFPSTVASMTLAMSVKLTKNWLSTKKREQLLKEEKLETELKFLRSQFNPHFLFNTINSIFVLINQQPAKASDALAQFSELLRYQLYECNDQQITTQKELVYLDNFIELEKLRQEKNIQVNINIEKDVPAHLMIAPFILIPFVENAFKHVSHHTAAANWITINLQIINSQLIFDISNSVSATATTKNLMENSSGVGLQNVKRRLELLYPNQHLLMIQPDNHIFKVRLQLHLQSVNIIKRSKTALA